MIQAIVFFPLFGALIAGLFGSRIGHRASEYLTSALLVAAALLSWVVFFQFGFGGDSAEPAVQATAGGEHGEAAVFANVVKVEIFRWFVVGELDRSG
ncbi:MAG: hypothetical protein L3J13_08260, partial [Devosiaceae bacterium]|nr:hypothetical protein [Devosiaceae bacterium]